MALNVYIGLCYYKLDYYDFSQELLAVYIQKYPDSVIATNLKACNYFRVYNGKAAEAEIKSLLVSLALSTVVMVCAFIFNQIIFGYRIKMLVLHFSLAKTYFTII